MKKVCWFSGGVSSFIAAYLCRDTLDALYYIDIDDQHPDTLRFLHDCEEVLGKEVQILKSPYENVDNVIKAYRFINSPYGARCSMILKKRVRKEWEMQQTGELIYVWGYDCTESYRAERLEETNPEYEHEFPLVDAGITKTEAHGMLERLGIKRPAIYDLGYQNNNCIGCVKGGMGYWNRIRVDFPEVFKRRAEAERLIGRSCIKGVFLDELDPDRGRGNKIIMPECGIMCEQIH